MIKIFPDLPDWRFEIDEASVCVYKVVATHKAGYTVSATGTNLEKLIEQCKNDVHNRN